MKKYFKVFFVLVAVVLMSFCLAQKDVLAETFDLTSGERKITVNLPEELSAEKIGEPRGENWFFGVGMMCGFTCNYNKAGWSDTEYEYLNFWTAFVKDELEIMAVKLIKRIGRPGSGGSVVSDQSWVYINGFPFSVSKKKAQEVLDGFYKYGKMPDQSDLCVELSHNVSERKNS